MIEKAATFANAGSWDDFYAIFYLLVYGLVLFPNVEGFIHSTAVNIFLSRNLVHTLLADVYYSLDWRNKKKGGVINNCISLLYKWFVTHLSKKGPFTDNVGAMKWF